MSRSCMRRDVMAFLTMLVLSAVASDARSEETSPTATERKAVAALAAKAVTLQINGEFQVNSVSLYTRNPNAAGDADLATGQHRSR